MDNDHLEAKSNAKLGSEKRQAVSNHYSTFLSITLSLKTVLSTGWLPHISPFIAVKEKAL